MFYKFKIKILKILNYVLNKFNLSLDICIESNKIDKIINKLKPHDLGYALIRVGPANDGGYLIPDILNEIDYCFSPGVGNKTDFEKHLVDKDIKIFLADGTIEKDSIDLSKFDFLNQNIASYNSKDTITLEKWISNKIEKNSNLLLQMDIESSEYEVISSTPEETLNMFKVMIIEFHYLEKLNNNLIYEIFCNTIKKIMRNFEVAHIHPNNCNGTFPVSGEKLPTALEITFLRKDLCRYKKNVESLPHKLDTKNIKKLPNVYLSKKWYK
jgi:hypothetical protein|tara:strand:- start:9577 stop:10383 length:807 start_codon:yes stop_codon:yes gene_type:complete